MSSSSGEFHNLVLAPAMKHPSNETAGDETAATKTPAPGRKRQGRPISELYFMLSHPLNYQEPKSDWVWSSSSLSSEEIFQTPKFLQFTKIILLHKILKHFTKVLQQPKIFIFQERFEQSKFSAELLTAFQDQNFLLPKDLLGSKQKPFSSPKFYASQNKFLASLKNHSVEKKFISPL